MTNGNEITANYFNGYLRGGISGSCAGNCGGNASSATYTNTWYPTTDIWFNSTDDRNRFHFTYDGSSYYKSHEHHVFRNYEDTDVCQIDTWGIIASFEVVTTARDYLGIPEPNTLTGFPYKRIKVYYGSFTEYHRCFIEDP